MSLDTLDAPACAPSLDASAIEVAGRLQGRWTTAPFALLRYATLPCSALQALRPARCHAALDRAEAALEAMATLAPALTDDLFTLVSRIAKDARQYRRALFGLDYAFANTLTLSGEMYYNGAGASDRPAPEDRQPHHRVRPHAGSQGPA